MIQSMKAKQELYKIDNSHSSAQNFHPRLNEHLTYEDLSYH